MMESSSHRVNTVMQLLMLTSHYYYVYSAMKARSLTSQSLKTGITYICDENVATNDGMEYSHFDGN